MNIVLINQFYPPATAPTGKLLKDLAELLSRRGHRVTVLASSGIYGSGVSAPSDIAAGDANVRVVPLGKGRMHRSSIASKLTDYLGFFPRASRRLQQMNPPPDLVLCMTTPPFCGLIGEKLLRKKRVPYVQWCMDLYPEALAAHGMLGARNPLYRMLYRVAGCERSRASAVITLGPDMTELVARSASAHITEVPVWSDPNVTPEAEVAAGNLRKARGWGDDEIIFLYSGNMGRAHRAEEFAVLARELRRLPRKFRFIFSGNGPNREVWEKRYSGLFEFIPPVPHDQIAAHLLSGDLHLVSQQAEWTGIVIPSKFQAACSTGKPVVFAGPSECSVASWRNRHDAGWVMATGSESPVSAIAEQVVDGAIRASKGKNAHRLFEREFTRDSNCRKIADLLERIVNGA